MAAMTNIDSTLADALRILLPIAVADEPEWLPEVERNSRQIAYNLAWMALLEYDEQALRRATTVATQGSGGPQAMTGDSATPPDLALVA